MSQLYDRAASQVARRIVKIAAKRVPVRFEFPDGSAWGPTDPDTPVFEVVDPEAFYLRLGRNAKMAFGEAYVAGEWRPGPSTDLAALLTPFAASVASLVPAPLRKLRVVIDRKLPHHTSNTRDGSRSNIEAHYDMSNALFASFLDQTMTYSSAFFEDFAEPLEVAQLRKIDGILDYADVTEGTRVLEIGSGWGSLAIRAAERGAQVTSITLSQEQAELATERIKKHGLDHLAEVKIVDYRDVTGEYDAIVSIEMIEAVGEEFWPSYFSTIDAHLAPGGKVAIQAITMSHQRMLETQELVRLDPEVHLPRRPHPLLAGHRRRVPRAHPVAGRPAPRARAALRRDPASLAFPVHRELGLDRGPGLRPQLPPYVGVLSRLLRGRVRVALPRGQPDSSRTAGPTYADEDMTGVRFLYPGLGESAVDYSHGWDEQRLLHERRAADEIGDVVMLLEHQPVYTAGRRTEPQDRPMDGTPVTEVDRGGKITWHGPGQLVGYPIVKLPAHVYVVDYVRRLEEALIRACADLGVATGRVKGRSGVWLAADATRPERKIAALGVRVSRGVTMHGFALNCDCSLSPFGAIVPCGISDAGVTTLSEELGRAVSVSEARPWWSITLRSCCPGRRTCAPPTSPPRTTRRPLRRPLSRPLRRPLRRPCRAGSLSSDCAQPDRVGWGL